MTLREIKSRYKQSILGYFWVILNPFFQILIMSFVFSTIMRIPTNANANIPYIVFLYVALLPWSLFANSLSSATGSIVGNANLITKVYFPRTILPISTIFAKIIDFVFASIILICLMIIYQIPVNLNILWFIPIFAIQQIFTLGLSFFLSSANLFYRDIQYLLNLVVSLWFYMTPVIYPTDIVPDKFKFIFKLNPMSVIINAYRQAVLAGEIPNLTSLSLALVVSLLTLIFGFYYFKKQERTFADNV
jgi:homopolymeric O-antigen transport system permease protein